MFISLLFVIIASIFSLFFIQCLLSFPVQLFLSFYIHNAGGSSIFSPNTPYLKHKIAASQIVGEIEWVGAWFSSKIETEGETREMKFGLE